MYDSQSMNYLQLAANEQNSLTTSDLQTINTKNCSLSIVLTAKDQKPQKKSLKR